jgi:thiol-disulfide isomerase/thioredoxin
MLTSSLALAALLANTSGDPDPRAIIEAADAARLGVRTAAYTAEIVMASADGAREERTVTVWLRKWTREEWNPAPPPPSPPSADDAAPGIIAAMPMLLPHRLNSVVKAYVRAEWGDGNVLVSDLDRVRVLDPATKTITTQALAEGGERRLDLTDTALAVVSPLLDTRSLVEDSAGASSVTWAGLAEVDGLACDDIRLEQPIGDRVARMHWFIARDDRLFRRGVIEVDDFTIDVTFRNVHCNLALPSSTFTLAGPEGFIEETFAPPPRPEPLGAGAVAPAWTLRAPDGAETSLADLRGRVVLLDFWGSWCGPCRMAMPAIQKIHETYAARGVEVIGIACRERDDERPVQAMADLGCTYRLLLHGDEVAERYQVPGYPTLFVIDRDGVVVASHVGFGDTLHDELSRTLDGLLDGN